MLKSRSPSSSDCLGKGRSISIRYFFNSIIQNIYHWAILDKVIWWHPYLRKFNEEIHLHCGKPIPMLVRYIVILLAVGSLASCAVLNKVESARTLDIYGPGVIQNPVIADLDVLGTKVSGIATGSSSSPSTIKNMALADAIKKAKADVLVQPAYEMETIRGKTTVTVTGFPANYKNFRSATSADSLLIKTGYMHRANVSVADDTQAKKKGGGAIAVVLTLVLVAVVAALAGGL